MHADSNELLMIAYALEAFAQHYLSDLFSAGHIRTPSRAIIGMNNARILNYAAKKLKGK